MLGISNHQALKDQNLPNLLEYNLDYYPRNGNLQDRFESNQLINLVESNHKSLRKNSLLHWFHRVVH